MSYRKGHGAGKGQPRIEVLPCDELPAPIPATPVQVKRRNNGQVADSDSAKRLGRQGGLMKGRTIRLVDNLGLAKLASDARFYPYRQAADDFVRAHLASLATQAGGVVSTGPSTMIASAGLQLAASRYCFDLGAEQNDTSLMKMGSQLANDSRQNLMAGYEMAVKEAASRPVAPTSVSWLTSNAGPDMGEDDK